MKHLTLRLLTLALAMAPLLAFSQTAPWPSKPIKAVVPFAAGAATDIVARAVLEQVSKQLGQPIIIENKPGAGGTIGIGHVAHSEPDGYTILVQSNSYAVISSTYKNLNFDVSKDMVGVTPLVSVPMVLVASPSKGPRTLQDFAKMAKAKPGSINYASAGTGGATHLGAERLNTAAGIKGVHVPYKSSGEALTEVLAGRVDYYFSPIGLASQYLKTDRLVALAVSSKTRSSALPDVPTSIEAGLPNSDYEVWIGMFAPAKTPRAIINRLNEETVKALRSPELREKFNTLVMDPMPMSPADFDTFIKKEIQLNAELVKAAGIEPS
ncbi:MAG: tripartite tricarboxylate transporter substrate binding protein [Burkholderiaceae bacterium]